MHWQGRHCRVTTSTPASCCSVATAPRRGGSLKSSASWLSKMSRIFPAHSVHFPQHCEVNSRPACGTHLVDIYRHGIGRNQEDSTPADLPVQLLAHQRVSVRSVTQPCQPSPKGLSGRPAHRPFRGLLGVHSRYGLHTRAVTVYRDTLIEGFSHFVTSMTAPIASGWSGCRVGLAPTGNRRLVTAHTPGGTLAGRSETYA